MSFRVRATQSYPGDVYPEEDFQYRQLDRSKKSIRLVRILPTLSSEGYIQCEIYHTTIKAQYQCLSYMWGSPIRSRMILVRDLSSSSARDSPCCVGENLHSFLAAARVNQELGSTFWIDALCIDQANAQERIHQVGQMDKIYSRATRVVIWLGSISEKSSSKRWITWDERQRLFDSIARAKGLGIPKFPRSIRTNRVDLENIINQVTSSPDYDREEWMDYQERKDLSFEVRCSDYWGRAWIAQEVVLARELVVMLGSNLVPFLELMFPTTLNLRVEKLTNYFFTTTYPVPNDLRDESSMEYLARKRANYHRTNSPVANRKASLFVGADLLRMRELGCSIARDRIFSTLAFFKEGKRIPVDYEMPNSELAYLILRTNKEPYCICKVIDLLKLLEDDQTAARGSRHKHFITLQTTMVGLDSTFKSNCDMAQWVVNELLKGRTRTLDAEYHVKGEGFSVHRKHIRRSVLDVRLSFSVLSDLMDRECRDVRCYPYYFGKRSPRKPMQSVKLRLK